MVLFIGKHKFQLCYLSNPADDLARSHLFPFTNADGGQITIRCKIFTVTDDHGIDIAHAEHAGYHTFEYRLDGRPGIDIDSDTLVIMDDTFYIFVRAIGHGHRTRHRPGQVSLILFKIAGEMHILIAGEDGL